MNFKNTLKKRIIATVSVISALISGTTIYAVQAVKLSDVSETLAENSTSYNISELRVRSEQLDDYKAVMAVEEYEERLSELEETLNDLVSGKYVTEEVSLEDCLKEAENVKLSIFETEYSKAEAELEKKVNETASKYSDSTLLQSSVSERVKIYEIFTENTINEYNSKSYDELISLYKEQIRVARSKLDLGFATKLDVSALECKLSEAKHVKVKLESEKEYIAAQLERYGEYELPVSDSFSAPDRAEIIKLYEDKDYMSQYRNDMSAAYEEHISRLNTIADEMEKYKFPERVPFSEEYEKKRGKLAERITAEISYYENEIALKSLENKNSTEETKVYLDRMFEQLKEIDQDILIASDKMKYQAEKKRTDKTLLDSGRITETEYRESEYTYHKLEYEKKVLSAKRDLIIFRLQSGYVME